MEAMLTIADELWRTSRSRKKNGEKERGGVSERQGGIMNGRRGNTWMMSDLLWEINTRDEIIIWCHEAASPFYKWLQCNHIISCLSWSSMDQVSVLTVVNVVSYLCMFSSSVLLSLSLTRRLWSGVNAIGERSDIPAYFSGSHWTIIC